MNRQRRMVNHDARRSINIEDDCHATKVRAQVERVLELLAPMPDRGPVGPEHVTALAEAHDALNSLDRWLPNVVGYCCISVNRPDTHERGEWISVFSAHQRKADAERWLEHWRAKIHSRDWQVRLMATRVLDFRVGGPPTTPGAET